MKKEGKMNYETFQGVLQYIQDVSTAYDEMYEQVYISKSAFYFFQYFNLGLINWF